MATVTKLEECCVGPGGGGFDFEVANPENGSYCTEYFLVVCSQDKQLRIEDRKLTFRIMNRDSIKPRGLYY